MAETMVLAQNTKTRLELDVNGTTATFRPIGAIDEDINFSIILSALQRLGPEKFEFCFDLGYVDRINSCGVREWLLLMEKLPARAQYSFTNVSALIVEQANMISGIFGRPGTMVRCFQAPYHCAVCQKGVVISLEPKQVQYEDGNPVAPKINCPTCQNPLKFDWLEDEYFAFVKRT